jgi:hypothetical protein
MNRNKVVVVTAALLLVVSMAVAGVVVGQSNILVLAKKSSGSSDGSGDSGPKSSSSGSDHGSDSGTSGGSVDNGDRGPAGPSKEDKKDLASDDGPHLKPGDKACDTDGCRIHNPSTGFNCPDSHGCGGPPSIHPPGNFPLRCHSLERCTPIIHFPTSHNTIVVHKTKVIHRSDVVKTTTVFVPGVGLVQPFNCKLNENSGKIGCEFVIVKVIN